MDECTLTAKGDCDCDWCIQAEADARKLRHLSRSKMWSDISKHVVGPMPVNDFLQRFLRSSPPKLSPPTISYETIELSSEIDDPEWCIKFINIFQPICSNLILKDTRSHPLGTFESLIIQPDICVFDKGVSDDEICDPSKPEIMISLISSNSYDPFNDDGEYIFVDKDGLEIDMPDTETYFVREGQGQHTLGRITLGQLTAYASAQHAAQFRTHVYSVLVFPEHARLFRWDRSGVVVTDRFPICSQYLMEFFHLYNHATPRARGLDISVTTPSLDDASKARASLGISTSSSFPLVQLSVGSSSYIISREIYMNSGCSLGQSTRGFVAYSISRDHTVFLKDSWRLDYQAPEHRVYDRLHNTNVPHIPTVIDGGDVLDHTTLTQDLLRESPAWIRERFIHLKKYRHHRLVLREIATPLQSFASTKLLVTVIRDALEAHHAAYFNADVLHRNISPENIMIYNGAGLLINWDLSVDTKDPGARVSGRTGTWQFMSANLVKYPTAVHGYIDDVESFVHVITWVSGQYAKHGADRGELKAIMSSIFDKWFIDDNGSTTAGYTKMGFQHYPIGRGEITFESDNLRKLLEIITYRVSIRYASPPSPSRFHDIAVFEIHRDVHTHNLAILKDPMWIMRDFASALALPNWLEEDGASRIPAAEGESRNRINCIKFASSNIAPKKGC